MSPETQLHPSWPCPEGCSWEPASPSLQGKVWEEVAFQRRAVHPGELLLPAVGHSTPPPLGKALAPEQAGRPVPSSAQRQPLLVINEAPRLRPPVRRLSSQPTLRLHLLAPAALPLVWWHLPCRCPGPCRRPLWLHSRKHLGCCPPHLQSRSKRPPLSGFLLGVPDTPNPTALHVCCFPNPLPSPHQGT